MASRPCATCGGHGMRCKCGGGRVPKRKAETPPAEAPVAKRQAVSAASGAASAAASAASGASGGASAAASAPATTLKAGIVQRLVLFRTIFFDFLRTGNRSVYLKKFDAADGKSFVLDTMSMTDEDVKRLRRAYKCNVFRVHDAWKRRLAPITDNIYRRIDETGALFSFEGYREEIYVDDIRPYCIQCGGKTIRNRKRGKAKVQTYLCQDKSCGIEMTKKMAGYVFANLGDVVARAKKQGVTLREMHLELLRKCKTTLKYDTRASLVKAVAARKRAPAVKAVTATAAKGSANKSSKSASKTASGASGWVWFEKELPGAVRVSADNMPPQSHVKRLFDAIQCRSHGTAGQHKCMFLLKHGRPRLNLQRAKLRDCEFENCENYERMFHGCPIGALEDILREGFQKTATANGKVYGDGVYFARDPRYSLHSRYSKGDADGNRVLLVCEGIVGKWKLTKRGTTMLERGYRTGGDPAKGIFMKPFANLADVAIQYVIVWQEKEKK